MLSCACTFGRVSLPSSRLASEPRRGVEVPARLAAVVDVRCEVTIYGSAEGCARERWW